MSNNVLSSAHCCPLTTAKVLGELLGLDL